MKRIFAIIMVSMVMGTAAFAQDGLLSAGVFILPNFGVEIPIGIGYRF